MTAQRPWTLCLLAATLLLSAPLAAQQADREALLLQLSSQRVTMTDFLQHLRLNQPLVNYPALPESEQRKLLDEFLLRKLLAHNARLAGLERKPEVRAQVEFFADGVLAQAFQTHWLQHVAVSEQEIAAYYESNLQQFTIPARVRLLHLLYADPKRAAAARKQLGDGANFETLAAEKKGDSQLLLVERQWFTAPGLIPPLAEIAFALQAGESSDVIRSSYGFHVVRVEEREPARTRSRREVRDEIINRLRQAKAGEYFRKLLADARLDSAKKTAKR